MVRIIDKNKRMCTRHDKYYKNCPMCQVNARIEEHRPNQQKISIQVPVYRKHIKINNKYKSDGSLYGEDKTS